MNSWISVSGGKNTIHKQIGQNEANRNIYSWSISIAASNCG